MNARQLAEIERRAHSLRRAELARLSHDLACLLRRFVAKLKGTHTFNAPEGDRHLQCR